MFIKLELNTFSAMVFIFLFFLLLWRKIRVLFHSSHLSLLKTIWRACIETHYCDSSTQEVEEGGSRIQVICCLVSKFQDNLGQLWPCHKLPLSLREVKVTKSLFSLHFVSLCPFSALKGGLISASPSPCSSELCNLDHAPTILSMSFTEQTGTLVLVKLESFFHILMYSNSQQNQIALP